MANPRARATIAVPAAVKRIGNKRTRTSSSSIPGVLVTGPVPRVSSSYREAPASKASTRSHGTRRRGTRCWASETSADRRATEATANDSSTRAAAVIHAAASIPERLAPGSVTGDGPKVRTAHTAAAQPTITDAASGTKLSKATLPATRIGPTPRADSSCTSVRRRTVQ